MGELRFDYAVVQAGLRTAGQELRGCRIFFILTNQANHTTLKVTDNLERKRRPFKVVFIEIIIY